MSEQGYDRSEEDMHDFSDKDKLEDYVRIRPEYTRIYNDNKLLRARLAVAEAALREQIEEYDGFSEDAVTLRRVIDIAHRALQDMEKK